MTSGDPVRYLGRMRYLATLLPFLLIATPLAAREPPAPTPPAVVGLFESLAEAIEEGDVGAIANHFDHAALAGDLLESGAVAAMPLPKGFTRERLAKTVVTATLNRPGLIDSLGEYRLSNFIAATETTRAQIDVRSRDVEGIWSRARFWLTEREGEWRVADQEQVDYGLRISGMLVLGIQLAASSGGGRRPEMRTALMDFISGIQDMAAGNVESARMTLEEIPADLLPSELEGPRLIGLAALDADEGDAQAALESLGRAEQTSPDSPIIHYIRALAFSLLERPEEALRSAEEYLRRVGPDVDGYVALAKALWRLGRKAEALEAATAGAKDDPKSGEALAWLVLTLPPERRKEATLRLGRIEPREQEFDLLCDILGGEEAFELLNRFATAWKVIEPKSPDGPYRLGHALRGQGQLKEAEAAYREGLRIATDPDLFSYYQEPLLELILDRGATTEAYEAARDREEGIWFLGSHAFAQEDARGTLRKLAALVPADAKGMLGRVRGLFLVRAHYIDLAWPKMLEILPALTVESEARLEKHLADDEDPPEKLYTLLYECEDLLVRALIATKQLAKAEKRARHIYERDDDPVSLTYVRLAKGEYAAALQLLERLVGEGYLSPEEALDDELIKDHLQHDTLRELRTKLLEMAKNSGR